MIYIFGSRGFWKVPPRKSATKNTFFWSIIMETFQNLRNFSRFLDLREIEKRPQAH